MIGKVFGFMLLTAMNGFIALFFALIFYLIVVVVAAVAMIPVGIIVGDKIATSIYGFFGADIVFRIIYAFTFFALMADDLGIPNVKTFFKKWRERRRKD